MALAAVVCGSWIASTQPVNWKQTILGKGRLLAVTLGLLGTHATSVDAASRQSVARYHEQVRNSRLGRRMTERLARIHRRYGELQDNFRRRRIRASNWRVSMRNSLRAFNTLPHVSYQPSRPGVMTSGLTFRRSWVRSSHLGIAATHRLASRHLVKLSRQRILGNHWDSSGQYSSRPWWLGNSDS